MESVSALLENPCAALGKSVTTWILVFRGMDSSRLLPAEDAGTLPALLRSDFTDESIAIAVRSCLSFSFVGSMKRILQKMTVVFGSMDLIFGKTKQEIVSSKTKESYSAVFHLRFIRSISMRNMGNLVRNI